jgi:adenosylmethionine-8-amino-7-oxononanoate aminotransferase
MKTDEIIALDKKYIWHPCTQQKDLETLPPIPITHGEGVYLFDSSGNRYIDGVSSWWVNNLGHNNKRLNKALSDQAGKVAHHIFAGMTHEPAVNLAERLCKLAPGNMSKVFFTDNGSSAVEAAMKMSFQFWQQSGHPGKTRFVSLTDAYHGETIGALSVSGCELYREIYKPILLDGYQAQGPDCYRCPYGKHRDSCEQECFIELENIVAKNAKSIAAVIIEPLVQGAAGMRVYPPGYLKKLRQLCDTYEVHYIADEIAVGFGRTGRMFANEHAGVAPDLLCLSKGITGGYMPLAVVLTHEQIYQAFYDDYASLKAFLHSHSYSGNPLGCALANEVLNIFEEDAILESLNTGIEIMKNSKAMFEQHPNIGEMRQCGMIAALEMVQDKDHKTPYPWQQRRGLEVYKKALSLGALLRPLGNVVYFMPPLTIEPHELEQLLDIAMESIHHVTTE